MLLDLGAPDPEVEVAPIPELRIAGDERFDLDLGQASLGEAIHLIAERAGVNIYLDEDLGETVHASFPSVTLDDALQTLLSRNGLRLVQGAGDIYWVERADGTQPVLAQFQLHSIRAEDIASNLQELVAGGSTVVVDTTHNFVVVRGAAGDAYAVESYLKQVDRLKPQVLIEVHLFEVSLDDNFDFGSNFNFTGSVSGDAFTLLQNFGNGGSPFSATLTDDDFELTIDALRSYVTLELLSSPRVLAVTNTEATVEVIEEIPFIETTSTTSGTTAGIGATVQEAVQFKEAGIKLSVLPTIQADGVLQILIDQELSEVVGTFNDIPILDTRKLTSNFLVEDRQTIVLGGLMQDRHIEQDSGVPLLMHIPFIGHLFQNDTNAVTKRELLVFVTSRILDPGQAARLAPHYQDVYREARGDLVPPVIRSLDSLDVDGGLDSSTATGTVQVANPPEAASSEAPRDFLQEASDH